MTTSSRPRTAPIPVGAKAAKNPNDHGCLIAPRGRLGLAFFLTRTTSASRVPKRSKALSIFPGSPWFPII